MQKLVLQTLGWILAYTPEGLLRGMSAFLGEMIFRLSPRRRRVALSNLHHAFPERTEAWRRQIARQSSRRLVETALLSLATPCLDEKRLREIVGVSPRLVQIIERQLLEPRAIVVVTPHMAYWEAQTCMPLVLPRPFPEMAVIYRPLDNAAADAWVKRSRERFGIKMHSRRQGFVELLKVLRQKGFATVLFDQNAGLQGALTLLFDRVCSTTELAGLMVEKFSSELEVIYPRRLGFWRVELCLEVVTHDNTVEGATIALNRWLERTLSSNDNLCASWLWAHDRWRNQDIPSKRFFLEAKRNFLPAELRIRELTELPRRTRVFIRMPNWLGDVVMALPLLRALCEGRPDAEITLLAKAQFRPLLKSWNVADHVEPLPRHGWGYFGHFRRMRSAYPDVWLLFTNSLRGDLEAWLSGCPQRFGLVRPGKIRPLLSHAYRIPADFEEREHHQLELWGKFLGHFGLKVPPALSPLHASANGKSGIGLIAGSENNPAKRWPVPHWRALIEAQPAERFILFGTANDRPITDAIAAGFGERVENLAGRTSLPEYGARLRSCRLLVTNDTGGMHLANSLGVPLVALFGPTNPIRTRPVFDATVVILQPPGCPPTGGASLNDLAPAQVIDAIAHFDRAVVAAN
ncbi:MAG: hypothetical protein JWM35_1476 [Verrucomicrobia bacterium]|nr:hypothetical protein [Verrucomicrobiota bacterium]